ncbi:hypothetical protein SRABI83_02807 [Arthrobacter sp. Bi83]|uniref:hypothetical protein n=1 Tax=Arthrobacter sp. Bi83 TaxID=2822353 RepID=UPI001DC956F7|nr:hypothetical protein [Arthrobacter sp. Bi83]CAH0238139.1 hypothetical protein SRABI83_02807 [Arthrobacter sp. Bi83]
MKNFARPLTAAAVFATVALTACSAPTAGSAPSPSSSPDSSGSSSNPAAAPSAGTTSGAFGGFATAAEACTTISQQATGASLLPLSAAQGKTAELEQKKAELSETAERVPESLKADFARLNEVAVAGLSDQTVYSSGKFQDAMAPVTKWLASNCS